MTVVQKEKMIVVHFGISTELGFSKTWRSTRYTLQHTILISSVVLMCSNNFRLISFHVMHPFQEFETHREFSGFLAKHVNSKNYISIMILHKLIKLENDRNEKFNIGTKHFEDIITLVTRTDPFTAKFTENQTLNPNLFCRFANIPIKHFGGFHDSSYEPSCVQKLYFVQRNCWGSSKF